MEKSNYRESILTDRGLYDYLDGLEIPEEDLNKSGTLILDLGAGIRQRFAKEVSELNLKSKVISVDPRLGLDEQEDLSLPATEREIRIAGRKSPAPRSLAATSEALPFKDGTFERIYALYSVPYYLSRPEEVKQTIREVLRVLVPGGAFHAYPVLDEQVAVIDGILKRQKNIEYNIKRKDEDWLLILRKGSAVS